MSARLELIARHPATALAIVMIAVLTAPSQVISEVTTGIILYLLSRVVGRIEQ